MNNLLNTLSRPKYFAFFLLAFSLFGLVLIYDASIAESFTRFGHPWRYVAHQSVWFLLGIAMYTVFSFIPIKLWRTLSPAIFLLAIVLLVLVLIPGIGEESLGAQRWIIFGPIRIQPAEITKLAVILFFSSWLEKHQRFAPFLLMTSFLFGLILLQPNLSTASIVVFIASLLYFLAGGNTKPLLGFAAFGGLALLVLILIAPYRRERLSTFLNPESEPLGRSYHIRQITLALGRGGMFGQGIGLSTQKQQYIPEVSTDSIFSIYAEETGYLGSVLLLGVYGILIATGHTIAKRQQDGFSFLVAAGITGWLTLHVVLNIAAMAALVPLTGVPLPLISYGGSSFVSFMIALGILTSIARQDTEAKAPKPHRRTLARRSQLGTMKR
jgi:cell division protein FtsW